MTIEDTTGGNDLHWRTGHWALLAFAKLDNGWDQDGGWDISSVSTSLTTLSTNDIDAEVQALLHMLWVSDHVHVENAGLMNTFDDMLRWHTNSRDEEFGSAVDDDIDKLIELTLGVIVARK